MRALVPIISSLNNAYGAFAVKNMYLSTDQLQERFEHDLLLLGGPKNSKVVADFLNLIADYQPLAHSKNQFIWREASVAGWSADKVEELLGEIEGERLVQDYGVIIRTANPFTSQHRTVTLIAGSHTAGVTAAAKYLTQDEYRDFSFRVLKDCNIAAVVSATIRDDYPVAIKLRKFYTWPKQDQSSGHSPLPSGSSTSNQKLGTAKTVKI